ncbi:MAG: phosphodiesterase [Clostridia bacterium]|nr:phosphodiesterase [Clostridia bacterium]
MKYLIASDLHGSAKYTEQLLAAYDREGADRLLLLGDLLYHGPRNDLPDGYAPKKVAELLNARRGEILSVRGNCEAEVDQMMLNFPILGDYCLLSEGNRTVFATHGHVYNRDNLPPLKEGDVLLYGHTHVPLSETVLGVVCLNPGSVSIPKEGSPRGYMTLEGGVFRWMTLAGEEYNSFDLNA